PAARRGARSYPPHGRGWRARYAAARRSRAEEHLRRPGQRRPVRPARRLGPRRRRPGGLRRLDAPLSVVARGATLDTASLSRGRRVSLTVCLAPANTIGYPQGGGHLWVYLNWALALRAIGCRVIWLEGVDDAEGDASLARRRRWRGRDVRECVATLKAHLGRY